MVSESCTNSTGKRELPRVDQPQASDTVDEMVTMWKAVNTAAKKTEFLQAPVASL